MNEHTKFSQKAFLYHSVEFTFFDKYLEYGIEDEKFRINFSVPYDAIPLKKSFLTYREKWPIYILIACVPAIIASFLFANASSFSNPIILAVYCLSLACMVGLSILSRITKFQADVIETAQGKVLIFNRPRRQEIIDEIYRRRALELRRRHLAIDPFNNPEAEIQKFRQLKEENIITEQEYLGAIEKLMKKQDKL